MQLYYFETQGDKFLGEYDYETPAVVLSFCNAKFFGSKKSAKIWRDKFCKDVNDSVLVSFICTDWQREE